MKVEIWLDTNTDEVSDKKAQLLVEELGIHIEKNWDYAYQIKIDGKPQMLIQ